MAKTAKAVRRHDNQAGLFFFGDTHDFPGCIAIADNRPDQEVLEERFVDNFAEALFGILDQGFLILRKIERVIGSGREGRNSRDDIGEQHFGAKTPGQFCCPGHCLIRDLAEVRGR